MPGRSNICGECSERSLFGANGKCSQCYGSGVNLELGSAQAQCRRCNGTGQCPACEGTGVLRRNNDASPLAATAILVMVAVAAVLGSVRSMHSRGMIEEARREAAQYAGRMVPAAERLGTCEQPSRGRTVQSGQNGRFQITLYITSQCERGVFEERFVVDCEHSQPKVTDYRVTETPR